MANRAYTHVERSKNQRTIILTTAAVVGVIFISGRLQSWPISSYVVIALVLAPLVALCWWVFASPEATRRQ